MVMISNPFLWLSENQSWKADTNDPKLKTDPKEVKRSDGDQSEQLSQIGSEKMSDGSKETLLKKMSELHKLQEHYNKLSHAYRHQQLDKREAADTQKFNTELTKTLEKRSEELREVQGGYSSLLQEREAQMEDGEGLALARKTIHDLTKTVRQIETDSRTQQMEMTVLKDLFKNETAKWDKAMELKATAEQQVEQLRSELESTQRHLQLCKDDLFRLQPMAQMPDTEVVKEFESVCQDVISWIDVEISAFEKTYPNAEQGQIFSGGAIPEAVYLLEQFPTFGEYWVRFLIHHCLHYTVFSRAVYLLGLPKETKQYLQAAEESMASLEPRRDFETVNAWRSETLKALAATPRFAIHREARIKSIVTRVFQTVGQFFPIIHIQAQSKQRFLDQVALPAAELASKIQVAASIYEVCLAPNPFLAYAAVTVDDLKHMKMIDIKTQKTIQGASAVVPDEERRIGALVMNLEPSLWRIDKNEEFTLLRREVNLIELDQPWAKRSKASA